MSDETTTVGRNDDEQAARLAKLKLRRQQATVLYGALRQERRPPDVLWTCPADPGPRGRGACSMVKVWRTPVGSLLWQPADRGSSALGWQLLQAAGTGRGASGGQQQQQGPGQRDRGRRPAVIDLLQHMSENDDPLRVWCDHARYFCDRWDLHLDIMESPHGPIRRVAPHLAGAVQSPDIVTPRAWNVPDDDVAGWWKWLRGGASQRPGTE